MSVLSQEIQARKEANPLHSTILVETEIDAPIEESFEYIVPVELPHIFKRYKNLPAIVKTSNEDQWYKAGMHRKVFFEDGNTAEEYLLSVHPHASFSYRIEGFTSALRHLTRRIEGKWIFSKTDEGKTHISWTYTIIPKNFFARFLINTFVREKVEGLLNQALSILKKDLEKE